MTAPRVCTAVCPRCGVESLVPEPDRKPPLRNWPRCSECKDAPMLIVNFRREAAA